LCYLFDYSICALILAYFIRFKDLFTSFLLFLRSPVCPQVVVLDVLNLSGDRVCTIFGQFVLKHLREHAAGVGLNCLEDLAATREGSAVFAEDRSNFDVIILTGT
jgi:hypothetical protein